MSRATSSRYMLQIAYALRRTLHKVSDQGRTPSCPAMAGHGFEAVTATFIKSWLLPRIRCLMNTGIPPKYGSPRHQRRRPGIVMSCDHILNCPPYLAPHLDALRSAKTPNPLSNPLGSVEPPITAMANTKPLIVYGAPGDSTIPALVSALKAGYDCTARSYPGSHLPLRH